MEKTDSLASNSGATLCRIPNPESPIPAQSMMMPTGSMHMAVLDFLVGCIAHFDNFDGEMQGLASQRMVAIHSDFIAIDLGNDYGDGALAGLGLELHADSEVGDAVERRARHDLHEFVDIVAISVLRSDVDVETVTGDMSDHFTLQAWNDVAGAVQVDQRLATVGTVDHLARTVRQC